MTRTLTRSLVTSDWFHAPGVLRPHGEDFDLPVRAVQFGTGAFMRGFVDFFLDEARRVGTFPGRVVAIGSTGSGRDAVLEEQDGLFTLVARGLTNRKAVVERRIVASLAGAVSARSSWQDALALAREPHLAFVFSNTTEAGIVLDAGDAPDLDPPRSFPGKLTAFLHERARAFDLAPERGLVVIPCELVEHNGTRLREIVLELAGRWGLSPEVTTWIDERVLFCDTLVDRIVTGTPVDAEEIMAHVGYRDALLTECEPYRLFAIEVPEGARDRVAFARGLDGVVLAEDIEPYRLRKVRLLNGAHTMMVPVSLLYGLDTVGEAVADPAIGTLVRRAMLDEIAPMLDVPDAHDYALEVLERFANPFLRHALVDISLQSTLKMRIRVAPSILAYAARTGEAPRSLAFGFAMWLLYMRGEVQQRIAAAGLHVPPDDGAEAVTLRWRTLATGGLEDLNALVTDVCADEALWGADLTTVAGFVDAVTTDLERAHAEGVEAALTAHLAASAAST